MSEQIFASSNPVALPESGVPPEPAGKSERLAQLSPVKQALFELREARAKLAALEQAQTEPIAVIGIGCRFPGGANSPAAFWQLLRDGVDAITEIPPDRWDIDSLYDQDPMAPGKMSTRWGGFLTGVDQFDPHFFSISPREAANMDPQHRLLLEVAWEALEHAGQAPDKLAGSRTGVFIGMSTFDYAQLMLLRDPNLIDAYLAQGTSHSVGAGRLSYFLGTQGPAISLDTACSSSLVAVHLAVQSLRSRESNLALVGGVNLILLPETLICMSKSQMMATDGRCKSFDARADGFVRAEGCAVVVLKRLSDALANRDTILAVIRGTAVNQDGHSQGITAPNGLAQEAVIREALANGKVRPEQVAYIEAHGTGTSLGDPIEVNALGKTLCQGRTAQNRLLVGSVKTNLGHLEAVAGVAGLIKTVLALQHREIPPHLHLQELNPYIPWDEFPIDIPTKPVPFPAIGGRYIAGVSSFGFSGTNAHVVLEAAPEPEYTPAAVDRPLHILTLSAKNDQALQQLVTAYDSVLAQDDAAWADICFTANSGRAHLPHRLAVVAQSAAQARERLADYTAGESAPGVMKGVLQLSDPPEIAFLFSGQGAQYVRMGRSLYETSPVFRDAIDKCNELLKPYGDRSLLSILYPQDEKDEGLVDEAAYAQPAMFALQYALAELWRSWGIEPGVVVGHSAGEYVAACVAGVFSLEDGLKLIAKRGELTQRQGGGGLMAVVFADEARVMEVLVPYAEAVSIAAVNGPLNTVISGERKAVEEVLAALAAQRVRTQTLNIAYSSHSPMVEPLLAEFEATAQEIRYSAPRLPYVSNLTGRMLRAGEIPNAAYWRRHLRQPVRFSSGMETLVKQGYYVFLELGPAPTLLEMARRCVPKDYPKDYGVWLPSLRKGREDWQQMLESLAALYVQGAEVNWTNFDQAYPRRRVSLPTYPFQRERYWFEDGPRRFVSHIHQPGLSGAGGAAEDASTLPEATADWLYEIEWQPKPQAHNGPAPSAPAVGLKSPGQVAPQLRQQVSDLNRRPDIVQVEEIFPKLEALSTAYMIQACRQLGWTLAEGETVQSEALAETLGIAGQHCRLFERILHILHEEAILQPVEGGWQVCRKPAAPDLEAQAAALSAQHPEARREVELLTRCGRHLAEVLQGQQDPLELLFPGGSLAELEYLYQDSALAQAYNRLVQEAVGAMIADLPKGHTLRILEIGAGTGGTTAHLLPHLPHSQVEYTFTDISPLFTTKAKQKFQPYPFLRYQPLDIEQPPQSQGFDPQAYDLVLAANVLHATRDLRQSLAHVRSLLAPNGTLLLLEVTKPQRFIDLVFGLTEGWWRFADTDLRPSSALLSSEQWRVLLHEQGFVEATDVMDEVAQGALSRQALLIARGPAEAAQSSGQPDEWLIFADKGGVGQGLARRLGARGERCLLVSAGDRYEVLEPSHVQVDPSAPDHLRQVLADTFSANRSGRLQAVYLWALDQPASDDVTYESLERAQADLYGGALHVAQALIRLDATTPSASPALWLVTQGAQAVHPAPIALAQAPLWGIGRVMSLEYPELWGGLIDLDPESTPDEMALNLLAEFDRADAEDQVAYRQGQRYVARLVRSTAPPKPANPWQPDGSYLITGGLGYIGLNLARRMAEQGARHLVLLGRSGMPDRSQWPTLPPESDAYRKAAAIQAIEALGATVRVASVDVSDFAAMSALFEQFGAGEPPLRGVLHAAGSVFSTLIEDMTVEDLRKVMRAKMLGTWVLHQLTQEMALDCFVMFSSGTSVWGSKGIAHHGAANHFMDAMAHHRQALGLPGLSINWGWWAESNLTAEGEEFLAAVGLQPMATEPANAILEHLIDARVAQMAVAAVDWRIFKPIYEVKRERPFLSQITPAVPAAQQQPAREAGLKLRDRLAQAHPRERLELLQEHVQSEAARVLGFDRSRRPGLKEGLFQMGMDSLMAVELKSRLETSLEHPLPPTLTFDYPNIEALTNFLAREILKLDGQDGQDAQAPAVADGRDEAAQELVAIDLLSTGDVKALLDEELAAIDQLIGDAGE